MRFNLSFDQLTALVQPERIEGTFQGTLRGIAALDRAAEGDLSFLGNPRYQAQVRRTAASAVLVPVGFEDHPAEGQAFLHVPNPSLALAWVCGEVERHLFPPPEPGIHPTAVIDRSARIGDEVVIGPHCVVGAGAEIGGRCRLEAGCFVGREVAIGAESRLGPRVAVLDYCRLGERVLVHAGAVIGSDGFGFETRDGVHYKVPQVGIVVIEDDVEIGANSTIDRARFAETRIGAGTKIDNLVQVGHNVEMGRNCILAGQAGLSGSCRLGDQVVLGGQVGVAGHVSIGQGAQVGGQSGVGRSIPAGSCYSGAPARPLKENYRMEALVRRLPELVERLKKLEEASTTAAEREQRT